ncbi:hypothetical protein C7S10_02010 [Nocardioides currus]|uniref:ARB-07466-like C-terminal domain-containing protein n=1 Tax=Nocardioides currus TaxID=2133958 RepID=A0A2R7Z1N3_9ACTN|nr:hypothetical protein C7S10_02010 [Nocardioides currus]
MVLLTVALLVCLGGAPATSKYVMPVDSYATWKPQKTCVTKDRPGTVALAQWLSARGGAYGGTLRSCKSGGSSEHKDGRAFDWTLDATSLDDQATAEAFITEAFADDEIGDTDALARRMGIMYVIWNDRIYSAWYGFEPRPYLNSGCRSRKTCSKTLRHRDHMHISLSMDGAEGRTSWYVERPATAPTARQAAAVPFAD